MARKRVGFIAGICLIMVGLSAGGCAGKRAEPKFGAVNELAEVDPSFQPGIEFLAGLDNAPAGDSWQPDDWILLGLKLSHDDQQSVWFVRLSAMPPKTDADGHPTPARVREFAVPFGLGSIKPRTRFASPVGRICIETYAHDGEFMQSSVRLVPQASHNVSLIEFCRDLQHKSGDTGITAPPASAESNKGMAMLALTMQTIGLCGALEPIREAVREQVLKLPNVIDVILAGLRVRLETHMSPSEVLFMPWLGGGTLGPCEQSRFPVCLAGQPVFDCRLICGPTAPPYHLTAGMLLFEAVHPDKPQHRLTVRVLAAKRLGMTAKTEIARTEN